ncbi:MAG TPA: SDR family oxidoreductase [Gemmatimonadaceae bacterium]|nr:SDR family oxidoreductase [Gemmatimonadaceae bacterium]
MDTLEQLLDVPARARPLADRVVLITGGGRGLGQAIGRCLGEAGATIVAADIRGESASEAASVLREAGYHAGALPLDVSDATQAEAAVDQVVREYGGLDVLINNAGTDVTMGVEELPIDEWDRVLAVNLRGPFVMSKFALRAMKARGRGHIVNIASTAAKRAWANASAYHASKWGLLGLSYALHVEARALGVKVTVVIAGGMRTPFLLDRFPDIDVRNLQDPANVADTIRYVLTQPEETVIPEVMVLPMRETSWP